MADLQLHGVDKVYEGDTPTVALSGIDLAIPQGDFLAIEGPSGGGKSTLLNIIGLLDSPTGGRYLVGDAADLTRASEKELARTRSNTFAFIFQAFHLLERRRVLDSVELGLLYRGLPPGERRERAIQALSAVKIAHLAEQKANTLSGGERQRVAIARALAANAPVVVADEPTGNLDSANGQAVTDALRLIHAQGATVVLVTHSPDTAAVAPRRVGLRDGLVVSDNGTATSSAPPAVPAPPGQPSRLRVRDLIGDAIASIQSRAIRSISLIAAVAVGVALAVATIGISVSANAQVSTTFNAHANRDVSVSWPVGAIDDETAPQKASLRKRLQRLAGVEAVSLINSDGDATLTANPSREALQVTMYGEAGDYQRASRSSIRWAPGHDRELRQNEVLLGQNLAEQVSLGPLIGEPAVSVNGELMTVVGLIVTSPRLPDAVGSLVMPQPTAETISTTTQQQALILTQSGAAQQVAQEAPLATDPYSPDTLQVSAPTDPSSLRAQVQSDVQVTLALFTGVALLASIAALVNTTILAVLERRQEFGLRRAVGARPGHVFSLVLTESLMLGALGGIAGLMAGVGALLGVTVANRWSPVFDFRMAPVAVLGGVVVGALGGLLASLRASRIRPSDALRA